MVENLSSALNNDDVSEANDLRSDLTVNLKRRNKLIKIADRSVLGWDTVAEYEADPIAQRLRRRKEDQASRKQSAYQKEI